MPVLIVVEGANRGATYPLRAGVVSIGREVGCDVVLADARASRRHAELTAGVDGEFTLVDLGSRNGTRLRGVPISANEPTDIGFGDELQFADTRLVLRRASVEVLERAAPTLTHVRCSSPDDTASTRSPEAALMSLLADCAAGVLDLGSRAAVGAALGRALESTNAVAASWVRGKGAAAELLARAALDVHAPARLGAGARIPLLAGSGHALVVEPATAALDPWKALAGVLAARLPLEAAPASGASPSLDLVAEDPAMLRLLRKLPKVARSDASVLVRGETGCGKEVIARAVLTLSRRSRGPYVTLNAAALPESLEESELFGHERGAFTGAVARRRGVFELADGGTLFLDEVGELAPSTQAKLLRVLETGEFRRVGGERTVKVDVRVIAATHRDLAARVREGAFREDLRYRLSVVTLEVPPLRDRPRDLEPLARAFVKSLAVAQGVPVPALDGNTLARLAAYRFPGNVRELRNVIERALIWCEGDAIRVEDLPLEIQGAQAATPAEDDTDSDGFPRLKTIERAHIVTALAAADGIKTLAASLLGIGRKTLYSKIAAYRIRPAEYGAPDA